MVKQRRELISHTPIQWTSDSQLFVAVWCGVACPRCLHVNVPPASAHSLARLAGWQASEGGSRETVSMAASSMRFPPCRECDACLINAALPSDSDSDAKLACYRAMVRRGA